MLTYKTDRANVSKRSEGEGSKAGSSRKRNLEDKDDHKGNKRRME